MARYYRRYGRRRSYRRRRSYAQSAMGKYYEGLGAVNEARMAMFGNNKAQVLAGGAAPSDRQKMMRAAMRYSGIGDYGSTGNQYGLFNFGSGAGHLSGNKVTGLGSYGGDAGGNQIMAGSTQVPLTVNASNDLSGDVYFSHREFVGNVIAQSTNTFTGATGGTTFTFSSNFAVQSYPLNAALNTTFPWLAQVATNFTLYKLEGCVFEYKPTSGEFGVVGSNNLGKVILGTQYDPDAPSFASSIQMENYDYATSCKPSEHMLHGIETDQNAMATNMLYTRTGPSTKELLFTDYGNFQVATEGIPMSQLFPSGTSTITTTAIIGELWVSYRVRLSRARLFEGLGFTVSSDVIAATTVTAPTGIFFPLSTTRLPSTPANSGSWAVRYPVNGEVISPQNPLGGYTFAVQNDVCIIANKTVTTGTYLVSIYFSAGAIADLDNTIQLRNGSNGYCSIASVKVTPSTAGTGLVASRQQTDELTAMCQYIIVVNAPFNNQATVVFGQSAAGTAGGYVKISISEINSNTAAQMLEV